MLTLSEYNARRGRQKERLPATAPAGVACDRCNAEMVYTGPSPKTAPYAEAYAVQCHACGHTGSKER